MKMKMMISSKNAGNITEEGQFPCDVYRKDVDIKSLLCLFYKCSVHKKCSGIRHKLKEDR